MNTQTAVIPREHDEAIAALYHDLDRATRELGSTKLAACEMAGFRRGYEGRRSTHFYDGGAYPMPATLDNAREAIAAMPSDHRDLKVGYTAAEMLARIDERYLARAAVRDAIDEAERAYTGWSRFFLVTSSAGHVHSSMHCSSCRPTTSYGWLPNLSGKTEAEAVEALGATLCSVCFPSAPVEWQGGKLTAAKAAALAA